MIRSNQGTSVAECLDTQSAAEYLGMSEPWVRKAVLRRQITFVKIGRAVRFRRTDLDAFLALRRVSPVDDAA